MTKQFAMAGISILTLGFLLTGQPAMAFKPLPFKEPARWIDVTSLDFDVAAMKQEITLDKDTAVKMFSKEHPRLREDWRRNVPARITDAPDAKPISDRVKEMMVTRFKDDKPFARVIRYSDKDLIVLVLTFEGNYLWHQIRDCKASFRIPRRKETDDLFDVASLDKTYGASHKGLRQGSTAEEVTKTLGKPDATIGYQAAGISKLGYFKDDIIITMVYGQIKSIETGVPQSFKDEAKIKGP